MKKEQIEPFFARLKAANPQPNTELEYTSVFELLTAVLLSAQATDVGVNKATRRLFVVANTPQAILDLGLPALERHIQTIGRTSTNSVLWRPNGLRWHVGQSGLARTRCGGFATVFIRWRSLAKRYR